MIADDQADEPIRQFVRAQSDIEIDRYSDSGINGELYFGRRVILNDRVALKFYPYNSSISSHQEPLLLKIVKHPNILEIYDARIIDNQYAYFLTPEVSGGDLQGYLEKEQISTNTAVSLVQGILKGLSELHKDPNNFVHRDLKPGNILIDRGCLTPFIADFGSIKKMPASADYVNASKNTFNYRPYEVVVDGDYFKESDIYQVGIILFQLIGGFFPSAAVNWLSPRQRITFDKITSRTDQWRFIEECIDKRIISGRLLDIKSLPIYIPPKLIRIVRKATHTDRTKRYRTCAEFLKALFDFQKNATTWWCAGNVIYSMNKAGVEHRVSQKPNEIILEKRMNGGIWRKNNMHNGNMKSIFELLN